LAWHFSPASHPYSASVPLLALPYRQVFCQKKQQNLRMLRVQAYLSVIPARFWPESRSAPEWIPAKGMPE
jgi:hypothetical protein